MGLTTGGAIGAQTALTLDDCPARHRRLGRAPRSSVNADVIVLAMAARSPTPDDADFILRNTRNCHGFYGASSMERLPAETGADRSKCGNSRRSAQRHERRKRQREGNMSGTLVGELILWLIVAIVVDRRRRLHR